MQFNQDPGFSSGYAALKHLGTRQKAPQCPRSGMNYGQAGHGANLQLLYVAVGGRSTSLNTMYCICTETGGAQAANKSRDTAGKAQADDAWRLVAHCCCSAVQLGMTLQPIMRSFQPAASSGATHSLRWVGHAAAMHSWEQKRARWQRAHMRSRPLSGRRVAPQWAQVWRRRREPPAATVPLPAAAAVAVLLLAPAAGFGCGSWPA